MEINMQLAWNYYVALNELGLEILYLLAVFSAWHIYRCSGGVPTMENEIEA